MHKCQLTGTLVPDPSFHRFDKIDEFKQLSFHVQEPTSSLFIMEPKILGFSILLTYKSHRLHSAITVQPPGYFFGRYDVTEFVRYVDSVPKILPSALDADTMVLGKLFHSASIGKAPIPFREVMGAPEEGHFIALDTDIPKWLSVKQQLAKGGFIVPEHKVGRNFDDVILFARALAKHSDPILSCAPGTVLKHIGSHHLLCSEVKYKCPHALLFNYSYQVKEVIVENIINTTTRNGEVIPEITFWPVYINGERFCSYTFRNMQKLEEMNIKVGSKFCLSRAS